MVGAVHYFGTRADHEQLLDHLGPVVLHPWPLVTSPPRELDRDRALGSDAVMVVDPRLGVPVVVVHDADLEAGRTARSSVFHRLAWERLRPGPGEGLVDPDASPVLLWQPARDDPHQLRTGEIGTQAESPGAVSAAYLRWVRRTEAWVRRRGTRVWGLERDRLRSDLDVRLPTVSSVYALPDALSRLEDGVPGRPRGHHVPPSG